MQSRPLAACLALAALASASGCKKKPPPPTDDGGRVAVDNAKSLTISVIGTNDLHGQVERLATFGGYLANLRAARATGGVMVLDGGDMFQGTLESNPNEGAAIVRAYEALGYTAVAIGNHEFDFGPVGPLATPKQPGDDPQGAIKARASEAPFPFLAANIARKDGKPLDWKNVFASRLLTVAGQKIGVIGVTTIDTPRTTISTNFAGLEVLDLAAAIEGQATALRSKGAAAVIVAAHAGSSCRDFHDPQLLESCEDGEIFSVARRLPTGLVDLIVAGHTHAAVAHRVNGIAIIEAYSKGRAFGRADLVLRGGVLKKTVIYPPRDICASTRADEPCRPGSYEGFPVADDPRVEAIVAAALETAAEERARPLGAIAKGKISRSYREESALGNLFVDLMLSARPTADAAITNGGGLRADLPSGPITYGHLFEAMPFDNRFAFVTLRAEKLAELFTRNFEGSGGVLSVAGLSVSASCVGDSLSVVLKKDGKVVASDATLTVATSDFLAAGGDGAFAALKLDASAFRNEEGETIRDAMAAVLSETLPTLSAKALLVRDSPRLHYPGKRPVSCR